MQTWSVGPLTVNAGAATTFPFPPNQQQIAAAEFVNLSPMALNVSAGVGDMLIVPGQVRYIEISGQPVSATGFNLGQGLASSGVALVNYMDPEAAAAYQASAGYAGGAGGGQYPVSTAPIVADSITGHEGTGGSAVTILNAPPAGYAWQISYAEVTAGTTAYSNAQFAYLAPGAGGGSVAFSFAQTEGIMARFSPAVPWTLADSLVLHNNTGVGADANVIALLVPLPGTVPNTPGGGGSPVGSIVEVASAGGTVTVTNGNGPIVNLEVGVTPTNTTTLTHKRVEPRLVTVAQSATPAIDSDNGDIFTITGLAQAITSMTTNLTGTPADGEKMEIRITDNGTPQTITWGASFASTTVTLPSTTTASTRLRVSLEWDAAASVWACIGTA